jgi:hypothetical protein
MAHMTVVATCCGSGAFCERQDRQHSGVQGRLQGGRGCLMACYRFHQHMLRTHTAASQPWMVAAQQTVARKGKAPCSCLMMSHVAGCCLTACSKLVHTVHAP